MTARELSNRLALDADERLLVMLYYTERCTLAECAAVLGVTRYDAEQMRKSIERRARAIVDHEH